MFPDLPPHLHERVVCSISAAVKYEVPANILLAIAEKEGGKPGQWVRNTNGTYDVGPMQYNTAALKDLAVYGITPEHVASAGCYPFELAAWRLRRHIRLDKGDVWTKAANYHSKTPEFNARYRADLIVKAMRWANWLTVHMPHVNQATNAATEATGNQAAAPKTVPAPAPAYSLAGSGYVRRTVSASGFSR